MFARAHWAKITSCVSDPFDVNRRRGTTSSRSLLSFFELSLAASFSLAHFAVLLRRNAEDGLHFVTL